MKFELEQAVEILSNTPETVKSLLENLSDEWTLKNEDADGWSAFDVVGHLIHAEETDWIPRAEIILAQGENPRFEPFDRFAQFENSKDKNLPELLETFAARRRASLEKLRAMNLSPEHLRLEGIHPELGRVTLEQLLSTWLVHDLTHIRQIVTVLAKKYTENVGVWREYLSILK
jgi:uncharacterized damage-inducible protein DinB